MNNKKTIVGWVIVVLVVILFGLKTTSVYKLSEIEKIGGPKLGDTALLLYGSLLFDSSNAGPFHWLLSFGEYKYQLIIGVLLIGGLLIYTLKVKNKTYLGQKR